MCTTEVNVTLADLLEVYRVKVNALEADLELSQSSERHAGNVADLARRRQESADEKAEKWQAAHAEQAEKVKKLWGIIESLHIELQNEREAHHVFKESLA